MTRDVYIVDALRTPVGKAPRGVFKNTRPDDLLAQLINKMMAKHADVDPKEIEDVVIGCAMPEAEQGFNVARIAALLANLPDSVPAMTINRFCSSGVQTIATAADNIASGNIEFALAGGTESMSMVPMGGNKFSVNPAIFNDEHIAIAYGMGITAEKVAAKWEISREMQDEFAYTSHQRAIQAQENGYFDAEIVPIEVRQTKPNLNDAQVLEKLIQVTQDQGPRKDTSVDVLAKLRSVFAARGSVTAGNSSQMSDGSGLALLASEDAIKQHNLKPIGRFVSFAVAGVPPEIMGIGPIKAIPKALKMAGIGMQDISWIELNEAFAAQSLAVMKELDLDPAKVNPNGGAIALGHPLGATGAIRTATVLHGLRRTGQRYGMVTMCIGTGMGAAAIFEAL
jgi:acetyl-CoA acyltransferase